MAVIEPDYLELWRELATHPGSESANVFHHRDRAEAFESASRRKNRGRPDPLLDFVKADLKPDETVLDIGAGTGRWSVPLAGAASQVTAVEPSRAMTDILMANAVEAGVADRIDLVSATWEEAEVATHDIVLCSHAMYMSPDLSRFVGKMVVSARRRCYLGLRHFPIEGVIQELSTRIHGTRHDSPNFIIAYNALYQMGIYANVLMETRQHSWTDATMDDAFNRARRHLHLDDQSHAYDELIRTTLRDRLELKDGVYRWPDTMNTALVWWDVVEKERP